jgi:hypothetical protein
LQLAQLGPEGAARLTLRRSQETLVVEVPIKDLRAPARQTAKPQRRP